MKMNFRDFKIGWRLLIKEPSYSAIVILGLSVGVAVCFLLLGLVRHQFSYDAHIADSDQIYYAKERWNLEGFGGWRPGTSFQARKAMVESGLPLIASVYSQQSIDVRYGERVQSIVISLVDPDFRKIFGIKPLVGDLDAAIKRPDAMALTEETAVKLFGNTDVVGKTLLVNGDTLTVTALLATPPATTTRRYAALGGIHNKAWDKGSQENAINNWGSINGTVFVKFLGNMTPKQAASAIEAAYKKSSFFDEFIKPLLAANNNNPNLLEFKLDKLLTQNLDPDSRRSVLQDKKMLAGLSAIAILILVLAMTNYLNLATVRALRRQREIAMRKVLGASSTRVLQQFFSESILVCLLASGFGLLVAWMVLPSFSAMLSLDLNDMFSWGSVTACLLSSVALGIASGAYPAWSALKVLPTVALSGRGNAETVSGLRMRRILTVLQFATAMGLTATAIAVAWQTYYVSRLNPGFDPKPLLVVYTPEGLGSANGRAFRDAVARIPGVTKISATDSLMRELNNGDSVQMEGSAPTNLNWLSVNPDFFETHQIKPKTGRVFDPNIDQIGNAGITILNESAVKRLGFRSNEDAIGQFLSLRKQKAQIVGVVPDVRNADPRSPAQASFYFLGSGGGVFTVRTEGSKEQLQTAIDALWDRYFPNAMIRMNTMESEFAERNALDMHVAQLLAAASMITIAIAAFGIYVLAAYSVQRRSKEIVLRKLYGASKMAIAKLVGREFILLIGIGAMIGLPVAIYRIHHYLAEFQDQAPIGLWTVFGALLIGVIVALLSTLRHTIAAVRIAPVKVLRD
jgi:putative ABC transport system permease protein